MPGSALTGGPRRLPRALRLALVTIASLGAALALNLAFGADARATEADSSGQPGDAIARGQDLYSQQCSLCHGELLRGVEEDGEVLGPPILDVGPAGMDFVIRTGRMPLDDPGARVERGPQKMSDADREAIIAWTSTIMTGGPEIPEVDPANGDLGHGRELFTNNCAACHGPTAAGIAVGERDIAPALTDATALEVAAAIRIGPGRMPVFGPDVYSQDDLDSVVAWVLDLRDREAPGGLRIGRSGPVFEGAVAWIVGLGLLLIVMYFLGGRTGDEDDHEVEAS